MRWERRYAKSAWADVAPSDLRPQGEAETEITYRHEHHLGLVIKGERVPTLGILGVRCEQRGGVLVPMSLAIADGTLRVNTEGMHSNPRRCIDVDRWREDGA